MTVIPAIAVIAGIGCGNSADSGPADPDIHGLWCGVGENVPDGGEWCLLVCENDRANLGDQLLPDATEPDRVYLRYRYEDGTMILTWKDGYEAMFEFVTSGDMGTVTLPGDPPFEVERIAETHDLCTSPNAIQASSPSS